MIDRETTIEQLGALVCQALKDAGIDAFLSGGAVVSIYSNNQFESFDLDFVSFADRRKIKTVMEGLGFIQDSSRLFRHPDSIYMVEFPGTTLVIGVIDLIQGYPDQDCSFIGLLFIREDNQAQGLGRLGYQAVEDYAREYLIAARLRLAVVDSNPAQEFWEKMGFRATGEIRPHQGNRIQSTKRVMEKRLSWRRSLP